VFAARAGIMINQFVIMINQAGIEISSLQTA
jgi:hypothetical protein